MTGHQWLEVLIGIAVALLLTWLLLIAALAIGRRQGQDASAGGSVPSVFVEWCPARPQPKAAG